MKMSVLKNIRKRVFLTVYRITYEKWFVKRQPTVYTKNIDSNHMSMVIVIAPLHRFLFQSVILLNLYYFYYHFSLRMLKLIVLTLFTIDIRHSTFAINVSTITFTKQLNVYETIVWINVF